MLQPFTLKFLKDLKKNNNKSWFDDNRKNYESARSDFNALTEKLIASISSFDPPIGSLMVKECVFRINRDVRFSKDKKPYKNNMACYFNKNGKKGSGAGYYLHIEPGNSMVAGGIWMPESSDLTKIRQEIDYSFSDWKKLIADKSFKKTFTEGITSNENLVRPPKGYDEDNEAIKYLKMKSFIVTKFFTDKELLSKNFITEVSKTFKTMKTLIDFLNTALV